MAKLYWYLKKVVAVPIDNQLWLFPVGKRRKKPQTDDLYADANILTRMHFLKS